ncbi:cupin domain-containing protein [Cellulomonas sp. H30R-01]|uniref:cupin domain-containing protein n=1 Tax=Cellulomonas sp. H30R-01 TaxID=2704467 RepID=UPI00138BEFAD|nr:cupin domain-containing protein [Cellulomonas sp. H30R-01]QHT56024.1 cupin domain-containing protein [Cellulomonas sp. H30R-01]
MNGRKLTVAALATVLLCGVYVSSASATPPSVPPPTASGTSTGVLDGTDRHVFVAAQDRVALTAAVPTTVSTFDLTYQPGQFSGWHSHPGIVVAVVASGTVERLTVTKRGTCRAEEFGGGESFTEVGPHLVRNTGDIPAVLSITRIYPTSATQGRIDEPEPACR